MNKLKLHSEGKKEHQKVLKKSLLDKIKNLKTSASKSAKIDEKNLRSDHQKKMKETDYNLY